MYIFMICCWKEPYINHDELLILIYIMIANLKYSKVLNTFYMAFNKFTTAIHNYIIYFCKLFCLILFEILFCVDKLIDTNNLSVQCFVSSCCFWIQYGNLGFVESPC